MCLCRGTKYSQLSDLIIEVEESMYIREPSCWWITKSLWRQGIFNDTDKVLMKTSRVCLYT